MGRKKVISHIQPKGHSIYFNEEAHSYKDELDRIYISATTIIGKYESDQDFEKIAAACERIGRNPKHPKYHKYKGKTKKQILKEWEDLTNDACEKGNVKHNYLEDSINKSTGYKRSALGYINDKIYTIDNILDKHNYGRLKLSFFEDAGIKDKYPKIYNLIKHLAEEGYSFYAEIGAYDFNNLISGLIDLLAVRKDDFIVIDWKTNKAPIKFEAGYWVKDTFGKLTTEYHYTPEKKMKYPLDKLEDSVGNHYALQTAGVYPYLVETWGLKYKGTILCHIMTIEDAFDENGNEVEVVELLPMPDFRYYAKLMIEHHSKINISQIHSKLF